MNDGKSGPTIPDEVYLATLADAARREQANGYPGWCRLSDGSAKPMKRLVRRGLVVVRDREWVMPTEVGFAMFERSGNA